jgi:RimJ/RimL family protein N-acetyltransferase
MALMDLWVDLDLGDLRLRTLTGEDAALMVEATQAEPGRALWGPHPAGPYTLENAQAALRAWDPARHGQVSVGVLEGERLVAALGLMPDGPRSAELAYWVRPERRRRRIALRAVRALTDWAHTAGGLTRVWLEIDPDNAASLALAERAGYGFEGRIPNHCRAWTSDDPERDRWHDCLIWAHSS